MLRKTVFVMNACFVGFLLLTSLQVSAQTFGKSNSCPHLVVATRMGEVELCRYSPSETSKFNLTLEKGNKGDVTCLVYTSGTEIKLHSWTNKALCRVQKFNGTYSVSLINLEENHADIYICRMQIFYPPPLTESIVNTTHLYVHIGHPPACHILSFAETWVLIGVSVFLFTCFMVVLFISSKRKHCRECDARNSELTKEHNSEYMHMASVPLARCPVR
ncbi:inducible T-cell costimulator [Rhinoderma darwinii]|uniref:inducible T-cell costimulator n=1 Tax=Rhinoderma darwinii TaxID=43563 RepID=UPI003F663788